MVGVNEGRVRLIRSEQSDAEDRGGVPEPRSVAVVYRTHVGELTRYASRLTGDTDAAADVVQEAFVRLLDTPTPVVSPRAWLYRVVSNLVTEGARTRHRAAGAAHEVEPPRPPRSPLRHAIDADTRERITAALEQLRDKERIAVLMRHEGFTHREIAAAVDTTTGSVGTLLVRAFDKLAEHLRLDDDR